MKNEEYNSLSIVEEVEGLKRLKKIFAPGCSIFQSSFFIFHLKSFFIKSHFSD
jgi:hypothetical protein